VKFLKKLSDRLAGLDHESDENSFWVTVQCDRCGEVIRTRIDLANDLSAEYGEGESVTTYFCRKVLIGKQSCYRPIEVMLTFDANRKLIERQITGGKFVPE
jgi:hypothetical protein